MKKSKFLINDRLEKFSKYSDRLERQLSTGKFQKLDGNKKRSLIKRLQRVYRQLSGILPEVRLKMMVTPAVAALLTMSVTSTKAQNFATPVSNAFGLSSAANFAFPTFGDLDNDGDFDVILGEYGGPIVYFENTGTASAPAFGAGQTNPFGLTPLSSYVPFPELADIDNDGDLDLFIGDENGNITMFENTGTPGAPAFGAPQTNPFGITASSYAYSPTMADIDADGDLDLLVGAYYGSYVYYENTGTSGAPAFAAPQTNPFGLAPSSSYSFPAFGMIDSDADIDLVVGDDVGNIIVHDNIGTTNSPTFGAAQTNPHGLTPAYNLSFPTCVDIDNDGDTDIFAGEYYGGILFYENITTPNDLGLTSLISPVSDCGLSATETVVVEVKNTGTSPQNAFSVSYRLDGGTPVTENVTGQTLNPGDTYTHTFSATVDLSTVATYDLDAWVTLSGDGYNGNDTSYNQVINKNIVDTYTYLEDFESGDGGWTVGGTNTTWELGTPAGSVITSAASGTNAWMTNLTGTYSNGENGYVESPCFDLTTMIDCVVELKTNYDIEQGWDGAALYSSIDNGTTWQVVGAVGDTANWYNGSGIDGLQSVLGNGDGWDNLSSGWLTAQHDISNLDGESSVLFRVYFASDGSVTQDGFAFDDFKIFGTSTVGMDEVVDARALNVYPNPASENVVIELTNATGKTQLELWNSEGKLVLSNRIDASGNRVSINVGNLSNGIYTVRVVQEDKVFVKRLSIQN